MDPALEYLHDYDDPYKILADILVTSYGPKDIELMLRDDECILRKVKKEMREQDLRGPFIDCVIVEIMRNKERMEMVHALDIVGRYFFTKLDLDRLRREMTNSCEELGFFLEHPEIKV